MRLYHITNGRYATRILKEGFRSGRNYFTVKKDVKLYLKHEAYIEAITNFGEEKVVILEVEVPKKKIIKKGKDQLYEGKSATEIITKNFKPAYIDVVAQWR